MIVFANFWKQIGDWFLTLFKDIGNFFTHKQENALSNLERILICIVVIVIAWLLLKILVIFIRRLLGLKRGIQVDFSAKTFILGAFKIAYWIGVAIAVVNILGISMTAFTGIVSAVTVAIGLAVQDIIGMFASGILLLRTKNFKAGDFISISNSFGTVEGLVYKITVLYTLLNTPNGQRVIIPNNNVTKSNVHNYSHNPNRRLTIIVNVAYNSDMELVKKVLLELMASDPRINVDPRPEVFISKFGDFALEVTIRCHTPYQMYWDVYNGMLDRVFEAFRSNNINIPVSTAIELKNNK